MRIDPGGGAWLGALTPMLRDRGALVLLDNCERVVDPVSSLAARLLSACPGLRILATSQRHLVVPGQAVIRVPPLATPAPGAIAVDGTEPEGWPPAVRLFAERARAVNPDFALTDRNAGAVGEICRRLDGNPFAIELAAARANVLTPEEIARRLDERFELLTSRHPATLGRHDALREALAWSASLLPEHARRLLEHLAVFSRGWTLDAARAVVDLPGDSAVDELAGLAARSLVVVELGGEQARFDLLDTIRLFLRERLAASPEHASIRDRHLRHYCGFASSVEREISRDPVPWLRRVREEHANLRDALSWAAEAPGAGEAGLRLCCDLRWAWRIEGNYLEPQEWLGRLLARAPGASPALAGRAWIALGLTQQHRGEFADARASTRRGLGILPPEERWERTFGELLLALVETMAGDLDAAAAVASRAGPAVRRLGDDRLHGFALVREAIAAGMREHHADAVRLLARAARRLAGGSDPFLLAFTKVQLALQRYLAGDLAAARTDAVEALRAGVELDNLRAIAGGIEVLGYLAIEDGEAGWAARLLGAAQRLRETTGAPMLRNFDAHHRRARVRLDEVLGPERAARAVEEGAAARVGDLVGPLLRWATGSTSGPPSSALHPP
jgi:predicted ATPase